MIGVMLVKGESERLPGKNFKIIGDKPLWKHNVDKVLSFVDKVYIITDKNSHGKVSHDNENVIIVQRPQYLEGCDVPSGVLVRWLRNVDDDGAYLLLQATNPIISMERIMYCVRLYEGRDCVDNLVTVNPYTCKPDGNVYIISSDLLNDDNYELLTYELWIAPNDKINKEASDIDTWNDYCIANAIYNDRIVYV